MTGARACVERGGRWAYWMSTYAQFLEMVRKPEELAPPVAWKDSSLIVTLSCAIESHNGSLPDMESSRSP